MRLKDRLVAAVNGFKDPDRVVEATAVTWMQQIDVDTKAWSKTTRRWQRIRNIAIEVLAKAKLDGGTMLEIGGRHNPHRDGFPAFTYHALDIKDAPGKGDVHVAVGDITNCPQIPDASYDFIFSLDVFEHINRPWLAASEIQRLLKPGGVTVHSTLFSWRYHPCPIDYWRYSPEGLRSLFDKLDCLYSDFDYTERRRDMQGRGDNRVQPDALGGWRENVRVNYAGLKPVPGPATELESHDKTKQEANTPKQKNIASTNISK